MLPCRVECFSRWTSCYARFADQLFSLYGEQILSVDIVPCLKEWDSFRVQTCGCLASAGSHFSERPDCADLLALRRSSTRLWVLATPSPRIGAGWTGAAGKAHREGRAANPARRFLALTHAGTPCTRINAAAAPISLPRINAAAVPIFPVHSHQCGCGTDFLGCGADFPPPSRPAKAQQFRSGQ